VAAAGVDPVSFIEDICWVNNEKAGVSSAPTSRAVSASPAAFSACAVTESDISGFFGVILSFRKFETTRGSDNYRDGSRKCRPYATYKRYLSNGYQEGGAQPIGGLQACAPANRIAKKAAGIFLGLAMLSPELQT
jgi:hypothetical protein